MRILQVPASVDLLMTEGIQAKCLDTVAEKVVGLAAACKHFFFCGDSDLRTSRSGADVDNSTGFAYLQTPHHHCHRLLRMKSHFFSADTADQTTTHRC